jgi:hypothetical protein
VLRVVCCAVKQAAWNFGQIPLLSSLLWSGASATALGIGVWASTAICLASFIFVHAADAAGAQLPIPDGSYSYELGPVLGGIFVSIVSCCLAFWVMLPTVKKAKARGNANSQPDSALEGMSDEAVRLSLFLHSTLFAFEQD